MVFTKTVTAEPEDDSDSKTEDKTLKASEDEDESNDKTLKASNDEDESHDKKLKASNDDDESSDKKLKASNDDDESSDKKLKSSEEEDESKDKTLKESNDSEDDDKMVKAEQDDSEDKNLQASSGASESCGLRKVDLDKKKGKGAKGMGRIVGGVDAEPNEFPWQVSIQIFIPKKKRVEHFCGGAILNEYWIVTASHCLDILKGKEKHLIVKLGSNEMKDEKTPKYSVESFTLHEDWDRKTQANDIAVLKVKEKIKFKYNDKNVYEVNSACLPPKSFVAKGTATLSGFGQTGVTAGQSEYLQKLDVPIYDHDKCKKNYKKYVAINEMKICAGGKGGQDSCMGDSGGPLVQDIDDKVNLIGIVSFGYPCAVKDMPGVYTKVSHYVDWINQNTKV